MKELTNGVRQKGVTTAEKVTYVLIVIVVAAVIYGKYVDFSLESAVEEALALGEAQKEAIEGYFKTHGELPQSGADVGLEGFTPTGFLTALTWEPGTKDDPAADVRKIGTLNGKVKLADFGRRFEEIESAYLLVARVTDDGTLVWECLPDSGEKALPSRYLPEICAKASEDDE